MDIGHMAFPYYITGTGWCVLLSGRCDACIFSNSKELPAYIHDQFDAEMNRTVPLTCVCRNPEDRLYLLDQLYQDIANYETHRHRMVNPCVFMISEHFSYFTTGNDVLIFLGYNHNRADYNYIIIKEPRLIRAFVDFSNSMLLPPLVYSKEDTLAFIRECMDTLKKQLS